MIKIKNLNSKVRLVLEDIPYIKSIAIGVWVKAGAIDEDNKYAGISHYIEHMMFKGTETRSAKKIAEDIDKIGGQINAFTGKEATCYYVKAIYDNYKDAADVLMDMMSNSVLDKTELDRERNVICEEIKMTSDSPEDLAQDTITSLVFKGNPLGKSIIGTPTSLKRITRNVMEDYFTKEYTRDSIVISVAGNFDENDIIEYFDDKLLELSERKEKKEFVNEVYKPSIKCITKDIEQAHICLATKGISATDDRYFALSILNNVIGGSMSSRLFQDIREEKGLAYSVFSMIGCFTGDGYFNVYAGVNQDKIEDAVKGIKEELAKVIEYGITEEELESSRAQLKADYIFRQENMLARMFKNGREALLRDKLRTTDEIIQGFNNVDQDKIKGAMDIIADFNNYSAVLVSKNKADLRKIMKG